MTVVTTRESQITIKGLLWRVTQLAIVCLPALMFNPASARAEQNALEPAHPFFKNIHEVGLYVVEPYWYEVALKCHGIEERCADENATLPPDRRDFYIKDLKETYEDYPAPLRLKSLQEAFSKALSREFGPFLSAQTAPPVHLDEDTIDAFSQRKGALTVTVSLQIVDNVTPHVAMVSMDYYRPECGQLNRHIVTNMPRRTAVPLSLSDEEIKAHITEFLRGFDVYSTREISIDHWPEEEK